MRLRENSRSASALATFLPRMSAATRLSLRGLTRIVRMTAWASVSDSARGCFFLLIGAASALARASGSAARALRLAVGGVPEERAGRSKLAELVPDHFLGHHHRQMFVSVVDPEGEADELRQDRRATAPDLDHIMPAR